MTTLFLRALLAFLALPGIVAFVVPWLLTRSAGNDARVDLVALLPLTLGAIGLFWCVREFYVAGRGTLAPWDPPRHLVVSGLYRYSRNPMYVAVILLLAGWALAFRSRSLAIYALAVALAFHLRVTLFEEPFLARTHGDAWTTYSIAVPRWLGLGRRPGRP